MGSGVLPVGGCAKNKAMGSGMANVAGPVDRVPELAVKDTGLLSWLALGDSYTIGQSVADSERYPLQAAGLLREGGMPMKDPEIIAVTGWTTQNLLNALKNKPVSSSYAIVTLLVGVNNQYQGRSLAEYKIQFTSLVEQSIQLAGNRRERVIVLSIPDYSVTPFARGLDRAAIAREIDDFNDAGRAIAAQYKVQWLDVTGSSRRAANDRSLIAADSLHFSGREYRNWASMLALLIRPALQ